MSTGREIPTVRLWSSGMARPWKVPPSSAITMNPEDEDARKASKPSVGPAKSAGTTTIKALERVPSGSNPAGAGRRPVTTVSVLDVIAVEKWIRQHVEPAGVIETTHDRPWATVMRVPVAGGVTWFKACAQVQAFEPRLTAEL